LSPRGLKIGEAAKLIGVAPYVLRFWETQFPSLRVSHTRSKHRLYQAKDLQALRLIKRLLHQEGFTIAGAKKRLKALNTERQGVDSAAADDKSDDAARMEAHNEVEMLKRTLKSIHRDLVSLHKLLQ
jgi:DNA-binding transcriptional MerR regulator